MQINKSIELEDGTVRFNGEISGSELDLVLQTGLLTLMRNGIIAATVLEKNEAEENGELH